MRHPEIIKNNNKTSTNFYLDHLDKIKFEYLAHNRVIDFQIFIDNIDAIDVLGFSPGYYESNWYSNVYTDIMTKWVDFYNGLSEECLAKHFDKIDWEILSLSNHLNFIKNNVNMLRWEKISHNKYINKSVGGCESFLGEHCDKLCWYTISKRTDLSPSFFKKHINKVSWTSFLTNPILDEQTLELALDRQVQQDVNELEEVTDEESEDETVSGFLKKGVYHDNNKIHWGVLCRNIYLGTEFWKKHIDDLDWSTILSNKSVDKQFKLDHLDKIDHYIPKHYNTNFNNITSDAEFGEEFFLDHLNERLNFRYISEKFTFNFLDKLFEHDPKKICWEVIWGRNNI